MKFNPEEMTEQELREKMAKIKESCKKVYGTCTDGSFEACLHYEGYYHLFKELAKKENQK